MNAIANLLRQADPLNDDSPRLDEARERIRLRVVAAAAATPSFPEARIYSRRTAFSAAVAVAATVVVGLFVGSNDRGILQAAVRFEVRLAETEPVPGLIVARVFGSQDVVYLHPEMIVTNDDIAQSWALEDVPGRFGVSVEFLEAGAHRMQQATRTHIGRPVAILIDGQVVSAPIVRSAISNSAVVGGNYTRAEAERIANGIAMH